MGVVILAERSKELLKFQVTPESVTATPTLVKGITKKLSPSALALWISPTALILTLAKVSSNKPETVHLRVSDKDLEPIGYTVGFSPEAVVKEYKRLSVLDSTRDTSNFTLPQLE